MIDLNTLARWLMFIVMLAALSTAGWIYHENHTLIATNAELARWVTEKMESLESEIAILRESENDMRGALRASGSRAADSVMRRADR